MGRLRRIAGRVIRKISGRDEPAPAPPARSTPQPPRSAGPAGQGATLATIDCGAQELKERLDAGERIIVVDVRSDEEVAVGVIPGALHIPLQELADRWGELSDADEVVCYCAAGMRSLRAARLLRDNGLINATSLEGGLAAWSSAGGALAPLGS